MLRRLFAVIAACFALVATQSAWAVPVFCRAEAEVRACHCDHAREGMSLAEDDCCDRGERDTVGAPGVALPVPQLVRLRLGAPSAPTAAGDVRAAAPRVVAYVANTPARGPPPAPRFLANRSLLI